MSQDPAALALAIGGRVRRHRATRGWTLDQLAAATGVSRRQLINVEQGAANPSVATLLRIGSALGVGLPELVQDPDPRDVRLTPAGEGAELWTGSAGGRGELVTTAGGPHVVELWDWGLEVGDEHLSEGHAPGTRELIQVRQGTVQVVVGDEIHELGAGDALSFPGDVPHGYRQVGRRAGRFTLVVFEPGTGSTHG